MRLFSYLTLIVLLSGIISFSSSLHVYSKSNDCVCYANGSSYEIGNMECLGGFWASCNDRPEGSGSNCGWDYMVDDDGNMVRCDE